MLRPLSEVQNLDDTLGAVEPYMDQVLGSDRRHYIAFVGGPRESGPFNVVPGAELFV